jgi:ribosome-binding factor A
MGRRMIQLAKEIEKNLGEILARMDFSPAQLVTVTDVSLSSLLDQARVFVSIIPDQYREETLAKIKEKRGLIKKDLAQSIRVKKMPEINFYLDTGLEKAENIERVLRKLEEKAR